MPKLVIDIENPRDMEFVRWLLAREREFAQLQDENEPERRLAGGNLDAFARDVRFQSVERSNGRTWQMLVVWARSAQPMRFDEVAEQFADEEIDSGMIASWKRTLGKPERRYGVKALNRVEGGAWEMAEDMKKAILRADERMNGQQPTK